jgi:hypothetical protein
MVVDELRKIGAWIMNSGFNSDPYDGSRRSPLYEPNQGANNGGSSRG